MRHASTVLFIAGLTLVLAGCGEADLGEETTYLVLDWNADEERYEVVESTIETLDDPVEVAGEIAFLRGGGDIQAANSEPETEEEFEDAISIEGDQTPRARYEVDDGVVEGWDYHSFLMYTLYHHLEKSAFYFEEIGIDRQVVGRVPVYYAPELTFFVFPFNLLTDNAAYAFTLDAFLIPPQFLLEDLPLSANRGVIVHEYSHAVFNRIVHGDQRVPDYLLHDWEYASQNRMGALDEGVADIFAALAVGEPNFIEPSISEDLFELDRDVSRERTYDEGLLGDVETQSPTTFNPYELGSVIASTVWALRDEVGDDDELGRAVVAALEEFSDVDERFTLAEFFNPLHDHLPDDASDEACDLFHERLQVLSKELTCER